MIQDVIKDADGRMSKALDALRRDLTSVRTGRANPSILDRVMVEYYGTNSPINQVASISVPESRMLVIQPWDKGSIPSIEKAIMKSDLGVTPSNDGQVIRIALPQLTEERRKQMVKIVHQQTEDAKVSIRNVRRDAITNMRSRPLGGSSTSHFIRCAGRRWRPARISAGSAGSGSTRYGLPTAEIPPT